MQFALKSSPAISPEPLGDMTLAPFAMTKRTEADLARAMAEHLHGARPGSGAEALRALRRAFPDSPLTLARDRARRADAALSATSPDTPAAPGRRRAVPRPIPTA